jgi:hypothetical protein
VCSDKNEHVRQIINQLKPRNPDLFGKLFYDNWRLGVDDFAHFDFQITSKTGSDLVHQEWLGPVILVELNTRLWLVGMSDNRPALSRFDLNGSIFEIGRCHDGFFYADNIMLNHSTGPISLKITVVGSVSPSKITLAV